MLIGRYTRMDHIGKGSFATVYRGVHTVSYSFDSIFFLSPTDQPLHPTSSCSIAYFLFLTYVRILEITDIRCHQIGKPIKAQ